jgi:Flp pilus assembly secretin CpaC
MFGDMKQRVRSFAERGAGWALALCCALMAQAASGQGQIVVDPAQIQGIDPAQALHPGAWAPDVPGHIIPGTETAPHQVNVSVRVLEFQTTEGLETGLSAYFARRNKERAYGRVTSGNGAVTSADLTFPTATAGGITVFLDRIRLAEGDMEVILQALEDENRASILARPRAMVVVGSPVPTHIQTVDEIPYEETVSVGANIVQVVKRKPAGVTLTATVPQVIDDDGDWTTQDDTYIMLNIVAEVNEEGQRITVALDDQFTGGLITGGQNAIRVPEFISRSVKTTVWVRHGQVLILGGLYRTNKTSSSSSVPWLSQAENVAVGALSRAVPGNFVGSPLSATIGSRSVTDSRRELVFLIKAEIWRQAFTVDPFLFDENGEAPAETEEPEEDRKSPKEVITDIVEGVTGLPGDIAEGIAGEMPEEGIESELGGPE